jgi:hypothetical protein
MTATYTFDFDLELVENRTLDGHTQELIYRPTSIDLPPFSPTVRYGDPFTGANASSTCSA